MAIGRDPRVKQALEAWAEIAPSLGCDAGAFRSKLIWQKEDTSRSHIVLRLTGPQRLILKAVFRAPPNDPLSQAVGALRSAHTQLQKHPRAHAPEVLYSDDTLVVMTEAKGKTLEEHLTTGRAHAPLLRRTGAWLSAFHSSGSLEDRVYQPKFMLRHVDKMQAAVRSGDMLVSDPELFLACCDAVPARAIEGSATVSAAKHGDFNLRNLVLGPDGETGLDFKPPSTAPVAFDIVRMLVDYAALHQPNTDLEPGEVLSKNTRQAFFEGYDLVRADDPAVQFLPLVQILNDWRLIPRTASKRSWRQAARMRGLTEIAKNVLG